MAELQQDKSETDWHSQDFDMEARWQNGAVDRAVGKESAARGHRQVWPNHNKTRARWTGTRKASTRRRRELDRLRAWLPTSMVNAVEHPAVELAWRRTPKDDVTGSLHKVAACPNSHQSSFIQ